MLYIIINIIASYFPIQNILSNAPIEFDVVLVQSNYSNKLCNIARDIGHLYWLEVSNPLKNMTSSVGIMTFPTEWKVMKFMFQTTNKYIKSPFSMGKSSFSMGKSPTTNQFTYQKNVNFHSCFQKSQLKSHQNSSTIWGSCIPSTLLNGNVWIHQVKHHLLTYKFTYKKQHVSWCLHHRKIHQPPFFYEQKHHWHLGKIQVARQGRR